MSSSQEWDSDCWYDYLIVYMPHELRGSTCCLALVSRIQFLLSAKLMLAHVFIMASEK